MGDVRVMCGAGRRGWIIVGIRLTKYQLRAWVNDDMELFEVFHYSMEILEVKTAAGVIAALWRIVTGQSVTRNETCGKRLTRSPSRSMAEKRFMVEPLSDSTRADTFPVSWRSTRLTRGKGKRLGNEPGR